MDCTAPPASITRSRISAPRPTLSSAPTPPGVKLPTTLDRPTRKVCVVIPDASVTLFGTKANAPVNVPRPSTVIVPVSITSSCKASDVSKMIGTDVPLTSIDVSIATCNLFTRTFASASMLSPLKPSSRPIPLASSAKPIPPAAFCAICKPS